MEVIADLHIHSRFSRATSKNLNFPNLVKYAKIKGLNLLGTGDFTHPEWIKEIKNLKDAEKEGIGDGGKGIYCYEDFPFILSSEISLIYTQEKGRRVHICLLAPDLEIVEQINKWLLTKGRLDYDGRPIFGMSCIELTENLLKIDKNILIFPAHAWTPWFGIFGSMSGFDSLKEAFGEYESKIPAIETGMSSDPEMNWKLSQLNNKTLISFSDSHSFWPFRIGRESTIFSLNGLNYENIIKNIMQNSIKATIETDPAYGKYHYDGHRLCKFSCSPEKTKELKGICPICKKPLIIGVENRVEELADQEPSQNSNRKKFYKLLPLHELISTFKASSLVSKKTWDIYNSMIDKLGNEFDILLKIEKEKMKKADFDDKLIDIIIKNREGKIKVKPGFDGVYGEALLSERQSKLF